MPREDDAEDVSVHSEPDLRRRRRPNGPVTTTPNNWETRSSLLGQTSEVPLNDVDTSSPPSPSRQRRQQQQQQPRPMRRAATTTSDPDVSTVFSDEQSAQSLPDRLTATSLGILRHVGGATLSTTGTLMAPPLYVTRHIVLPQLWSAIVDFVSSKSPTRLKDWFRIVQRSIQHFLDTLVKTSSGHEFRRRILLLWADLVDCVSAQEFLQYIVDCTSCCVKFAEACHTPETKAYLQQLATTACRLLDVLSDGRAKLLIHDWQQAAWAACQLLADPATTTALAELTAYLCYALEMERHLNSRRHEERARYHHQDDSSNRETLGSHPDMTLEEAILSSLDPADTTTDSTTSTATTAGAEKGFVNTDPQVDAQKCQTEQQEMHVRKDIDVQYLRENVEERAVRVQARKRNREMKETAKQVDDELEEIGVAVTVQDDDDKNGDYHQPVRPRVALHHNNYNTTEESLPATEESLPAAKKTVGFKDIDELWEQHGAPPQNPMLRLNGESPSQQFERIVNEILAQQRIEGIRRHAVPHGKVPRYLQKRSDQNRLAAIRAELGRSLKEEEEVEKLSRIRSVLGKEGRMALLVGLVVVVCFVALWFSLGVYGLYVYFHPPIPAVVTSQAPAAQEIVIRIIREVADESKGAGGGSGGLFRQKAPDLSNENYEKIADCVADLYN